MLSLRDRRAALARVRPTQSATYAPCLLPNMSHVSTLLRCFSQLIQNMREAMEQSVLCSIACAHLHNEGGGAKKTKHLTSLQRQDGMLVLWKDAPLVVESKILKVSGDFVVEFCF